MPRRDAVAALLGLLLGACTEPESTAKIAAVGDLLLQAPLQQQAFGASDGYVSLWSAALPLLSNADLAYANLEGPIAPGTDSSGRDVPDPGLVFDRNVYTGFPRFNYHPSLAGDLIDSNVQVVSTANNHSLDRGALGADRTLDVLDTVGLAHAGTRRSGGAGSWSATTDTNGIRLAWLACTYGTNGVPDLAEQVLHCYDDEALLLREVASLHADPSVDAVIVTPHWGVQYTPEPTQRDVELGRAFVEAGALAVIGAHPHVLQPMERVIATDGRGGVIAYSLGNFVSDQETLTRRTTVVLYLDLRRAPGGAVVVDAVRFVPIAMMRAPTLHLAVIDCEPGLEAERAHVGDVLGEDNIVPPPGCPQR
ncbi:MAG: CapA family protein [Nannocystaceae bacterium]|nr:CapA family protein [bacterium]